MAEGRGARAWSSPGWLARAVAWVDDRLARAGLHRTGDAEQIRVRAWATVVRVPTDSGAVWLKAAADATAFEVGLYEILAAAEPDWVLAPIATDPARGWILLPDGGPSLGERTEGVERGRGLAAALAAYGRFQRTVAPRVEEMLAAGVPDMRPARMPQRLEEALAAVEDPDLEPAAAEGLERVRGMAAQIGEWSARLEASPLAASLDHNDLHPWNVLGEPDRPRLYDWGDSVIAHPLASAMVPLAVIGGLLDEAESSAARDGYLDAFADLAPRAELREELGLACRLAKIARSLTWERALRSSREQGVEIDPRFADAALRNLTALSP